MSLSDGCKFSGGVSLSDGSKFSGGVRLNDKCELE